MLQRRKRKRGREGGKEEKETEKDGKEMSYQVMKTHQRELNTCYGMKEAKLKRLCSVHFQPPQYHGEGRKSSLFGELGWSQGDRQSTKGSQGSELSEWQIDVDTHSSSAECTTPNDCNVSSGPRMQAPLCNKRPTRVQRCWQRERLRMPGCRMRMGNLCGVRSVLL